MLTPPMPSAMQSYISSLEAALWSLLRAGIQATHAAPARLKCKNTVFIQKLQSLTHEKTYDCSDTATCIFLPVKQYL